MKLFIFINMQNNIYLIFKQMGTDANEGSRKTASFWWSYIFFLPPSEHTGFLPLQESTEMPLSFSFTYAHGADQSPKAPHHTSVCLRSQVRSGFESNQIEFRQFKKWCDVINIFILLKRKFKQKVFTEKSLKRCLFWGGIGCSVYFLNWMTSLQVDPNPASSQ